MQKKEEKKTNTQEKAVSIDTFEMVDRLVQNAQQALKEYMELDQEQVDKIVHAMTLAGLDKHMLLAKMAVRRNWPRRIWKIRLSKTCLLYRIYLAQH